MSIPIISYFSGGGFLDLGFELENQMCIRDRLKDNLHLSPNMYPVAVISLGYVKQPPEKSSKRKDIIEIRCV